MKRFPTIHVWTILASSLLFLPQQTSACDLCGCASAGAQLGVLPQYNRSFVGLRYQFSSFQHLKVDESLSNNGRVLNDAYQTLEIWGRLMLSEKDQLLLSLPYVVKTRNTEQTDLHTRGVGDLSVLYNRILLQKDLLPWSIQWTAGGGLRLPTGKYRQRDPQQNMFPIGIQVGTGAWAFPMFSQFGVRKNNWGLIAEAFVQLHDENENNYRIGNYYQASLYFTHYKVMKKSMWMPILGLRQEHSVGDREYGEIADHSGGSRFTALVGLDVYVGDWNAGFRGQIPVDQELNGVQPQWQGLWNAHLIYFFGK